MRQTLSAQKRSGFCVAEALTTRPPGTTSSKETMLSAARPAEDVKYE